MRSNQWLFLKNEIIYKERWVKVTFFRANYFKFVMRQTSAIISGAFVFFTLSYASVQKAEDLIYEGRLEEAQNHLQPYIQKEDPKALFLFAVTHLFFKNKNVPIGLNALRKAVDKNYPPALDTLGGLYLHGEFVEKDEKKALEHYKRAADLGYGPSQFNCGILYRNGKDISKDSESAYVYLALAAINKQDLDAVTEDATHYRDEVTYGLTPEQRQSAAIRIHRLTAR